MTTDTGGRASETPPGVDDSARPTQRPANRPGFIRKRPTPDEPVLTRRTISPWDLYATYEPNVKVEWVDDNGEVSEFISGADGKLPGEVTSRTTYERQRERDGERQRALAFGILSTQAGAQHRGSRRAADAEITTPRRCLEPRRA